MLFSIHYTLIFYHITAHLLEWDEIYSSKRFSKIKPATVDAVHTHVYIAKSQQIEKSSIQNKNANGEKKRLSALFSIILICRLRLSFSTEENGMRRKKKNREMKEMQKIWS